MLASLNLPAAIEDLSGERLPQSLKDKAAQIRDVGGISGLNHLMTELPDLLRRNREILDEVSGSVQCGACICMLSVDDI